MHPTTARGESSNTNDPIEDDDSSTDEGADTPIRPRHDVSYVHDFPARSTRSGFMRDGRVRGGAMLVLDDDTHSPIAFSAGLPGDVQLSQLPDPRSVREAIAAPDAEGWRDATDREMQTSSRMMLRIDDAHEQHADPPTRLGTPPEVQRTELLTKIRGDSLLVATNSVLESTMASRSRPSCASNLCALY